MPPYSHSPQAWSSENPVCVDARSLSYDYGMQDDEYAASCVLALWSCPYRAAVGSRSFLALSGWSSREWVRREAGEDIARSLPVELGGDLDLKRWSWEG